MALPSSMQASIHKNRLEPQNHQCPSNRKICGYSQFCSHFSNGPSGASEPGRAANCEGQTDGHPCSSISRRVPRLPHPPREHSPSRRPQPGCPGAAGEARRRRRPRPRRRQRAAPSPSAAPRLLPGRSGAASPPPAARPGRGAASGASRAATTLCVQRLPPLRRRPPPLVPSRHPDTPHRPRDRPASPGNAGARAGARSTPSPPAEPSPRQRGEPPRRLQIVK